MTYYLVESHNLKRVQNLNLLKAYNMNRIVNITFRTVDGSFSGCIELTLFFLLDQFEALQEELDRRRQECLQLKVFRLHLNHSCK